MSFPKTFIQIPLLKIKHKDGSKVSVVVYGVLVVKGLTLHRNISLLDKIRAIVSDPFDPVEYLYCRKHRLYYKRAQAWYGEPVFVICPKCFEEKFENGQGFP
jgi:hypothetical protein